MTVAEADLLAGAAWSCTAVPPGSATSPDDLASLHAPSWPAPVPGTAASALRLAGDASVDWRDFDEDDWWYEARIPRPAGPGPWTLTLHGLATVADVWLNGEPVLHSENMFVRHEVVVDTLEDENHLAIRFSALAALLRARHPRPRWKSPRVHHQALRWYRTTLLGRMTGWVPSPAPVGPWRPVTLTARCGVEVVRRTLDARCHAEGPGGEVVFEVRCRGASPSLPASVTVGDVAVSPTVAVDGTDLVLTGTVTLPVVERWWPHTHGPQPLYPVTATVGDESLPLGRVGFRTLEVDQSDDGFAIVVNGTTIFCRGACWMNPDLESLAPGEARLRENLVLLRAANANLVRVVGETFYEEAAFYDLCDELGLLVWQDCMFAFCDPPDDPELTRSVERELTQLLGLLQGRPSVVMVSGGSDVEEQAQFMGLDRAARRVPLAEEVIPALVQRMLPGMPYVTSTPIGGVVPTEPGSGIAHYFGVGAYFRPVSDARRAGVRFAAECLSYATPPEPETVEESCGGAARAGHHWTWKRAVHRDAGMSWDLEDSRDHYTKEVFGIDPFPVRQHEPERALDLGRATVAELFTTLIAEWRRPSSPCTGVVVFNSHDIRPGPGLGLVDAHDRPKAPWFVMRRLLQPTAVLLTDEGLNGLAIHVVHDGVEPFAGSVRVELFTGGELLVESSERPVAVAARGGVTLDANGWFDSFRDLNWAHRFGTPSYDVIAVSLHDEQGCQVSQAVHLPGGPSRPVERDLGLEARAHLGDDGTWEVEIAARRLAQWVALDVPGFRPEDSWFHLLPHRPVRIGLVPVARSTTLRGWVRALNGTSPVRISS